MDILYPYKMLRNGLIVHLRWAIVDFLILILNNFKSFLLDTDASCMVSGNIMSLQPWYETRICNTKITAHYCTRLDKFANFPQLVVRCRHPHYRVVRNIFYLSIKKKPELVLLSHWSVIMHSAEMRMIDQAAQFRRKN